MMSGGSTMYGKLIIAPSCGGGFSGIDGKGWGVRSYSAIILSITAVRLAGS